MNNEDYDLVRINPDSKIEEKEKLCYNNEDGDDVV
jgi:hypothetical protein